MQSAVQPKEPMALTPMNINVGKNNIMDAENMKLEIENLEVKLKGIFIGKDKEKYSIGSGKKNFK